MTLQWQPLCCLATSRPDAGSFRELQVNREYTTQQLKACGTAGPHSQALSHKLCLRHVNGSICCMQGGRCSGTAGIRCSLQTQGGSSVWDGCWVWEYSCSPCRSVAAIAEIGASWSWQSASLFTAMHKSSQYAIHHWSICTFVVYMYPALLPAAVPATSQLPHRREKTFVTGRKPKVIDSSKIGDQVC